MMTTGYTAGLATTPVEAQKIRKGDYAHDPLLVGTVVMICPIDDLIRIETHSTCNNVMYFLPTEHVLLQRGVVG